MTASIYLDTNVFITAFEVERHSGSHVWSVLEAIERGEFAAVTSQITLAELLPLPIAKGKADLVDFYKGLFSAPGMFSTRPITTIILIEAAAVRAAHRAVKLPDAIHIATARSAGTAAFLTTDRRLDSVPGLNVIKPGQGCLDRLRALPA